MDESEGDDAPLQAEAAKRDEWRGGGTRLSKEDAPGHSLPASESAEQSEGSDQGGAVLNNLAPPD